MFVSLIAKKADAQTQILCNMVITFFANQYPDTTTIKQTDTALRIINKKVKNKKIH